MAGDRIFRSMLDGLTDVGYKEIIGDYALSDRPELPSPPPNFRRRHFTVSSALAHYGTLYLAHNMTVRVQPTVGVILAAVREVREYRRSRPQPVDRSVAQSGSAFSQQPLSLADVSALRRSRPPEARRP
jgi:hypothetical protein